MAEEFDTRQNKAAESGLKDDSALFDPNAEPEARDAAWLQLHNEGFRASVDFMDNNLRRVWERNIRHFQNRHALGSKYLDPNNKHRSRIFRPRTRATVRKDEAAAAAAFFSTRNLVEIEAENDNDPMQQASAGVNKALLHHRLTKTIPWFLLVMGALQDTRVCGVCVSKQHWRYEQVIRSVERPVVGPDGRQLFDEDGNPLFERVDEIEVKRDHPQIDLIPPENCHILPGASWIDPINSSPLLIVRFPMFVCDVRARINSHDPKTGQPPWRPVNDQQLSLARESVPDPTRQAREEERTDTHDANRTSIRDFDIVWVHETFVRIGGQDWTYWTLGEQALLTDPKPLEEVYFHGERPYVMGYGLIETHKTYPASKTELVSQLQQELNEIANSRIDNVKFAVNGRYFVRRGGHVDLQALLRSVPGGGVLMNNPESDVVVHRPQDVTRSSYAEQDRLNVDFDELAGNFSPSSVQTNRTLNETVGGMNLLAGSANALTEYDLKIFAETWVQPVLRQLVRLEQTYETDVTLLALAGEKAQLYQRFGIDTITDELLEQELTTKVNVGAGSTNPMQRLQAFLLAMRSAIELASSPAARLVNLSEAFAEIFGAAGYQDGDRFFLFNSENPEVGQLQQVIEFLTEQLQGKQLETESKERIAQLQSQTDLREQEMEIRGRLLEELLRGRLDLSKDRLRMMREAIGMGREEARAAEQRAGERTFQRQQRQFDLIRQMAGGAARRSA